MSSLRQESRYPWFEPRLVAVVVAASALVWTTSIVVDGWKATHGNPPPTPKTMEVTAEASAHATPDHMTWTVTVHGKDGDVDSALEKVHANTQTMHDFLVAHGLTDAELTIKQPTTTHESEDVTTKDSDGNDTTESVPGDWDASQDIEINVTDIKRGLAANQAAATATELDNAEVSDATCTAKNTDELQEQVLRQARANVRAHALDAIKQYGGAHLGHLDTATIGSADVGSDCSDIVVSASAMASYELE